MITLKYDGTFKGLLCSMFYAFGRRQDEFNIQHKNINQNSLWGQDITITTETHKAHRVLEGLKKTVGSGGVSILYRSFLSEEQGIENDILHALKSIYTSGPESIKDHTDPQILRLHKVVKMVNREKHRMEAFVRFRLTKDEVYFASIEPDFDVLPLIKKHFHSRHADQRWLIYDMKRDYGLYYDLNKVERMQMTFESNFDATKTSDRIFTLEEIAFQELWKEYFSSTNIASRKNTVLHVRHVPKRYWKYLSEKQAV